MTEHDTLHEEDSGAMNELPGATLRREREARSLSVRQVASELHVDDRLLQALENDDFAAIGAPIFVKGHLRNYAKLLGIDSAPLIDAYERFAPVEEPKIFARKADGTSMEVTSTGPWVKVFGWFLLVLLLLGSLGWWYYQQESASGAGSTLRVLDRGDSTIDSVATDESVDEGTDTATDETGSPDPRAQLVEEPVGTEEGAVEGKVPAGQSDGDTTEAIQAAGEMSPDKATADSTATPRSEPTVTDDRPRESSQVATPSTATTSDAVPGTAIAEGIIRLRFADASWVEVYNLAEEPLLYDLVPAGSVREVRAGGELRVFLGNAPAVSMTVNGEPFDLERYVRRDNTARFRLDPTQPR
ncbi:MAG: DUF4115 domain-containing protein [Gammaproteobacteria bacterium]|nr:DUF4115 domain-containing protein [Gammaproteobacteria bacterium]